MSSTTNEQTLNKVIQLLLEQWSDFKHDDPSEILRKGNFSEDELRYLIGKFDLGNHDNWNVGLPFDTTLIFEESQNESFCRELRAKGYYLMGNYLADNIRKYPSWKQNIVNEILKS